MNDYSTKCPKAPLQPPKGAKADGKGDMAVPRYTGNAGTNTNGSVPVRSHKVARIK